MRFGLKCIVVLAILYRAIIVSQGGAGPAALPAQLADAVPQARARMQDAVAARIDGWCRNAPGACLANAARLTRLVSGEQAASPATDRSQGAIATRKR